LSDFDCAGGRFGCFFHIDKAGITIESGANPQKTAICVVTEAENSDFASVYNEQRCLI
jgi:hypothetical protein